jgi:sorting nexin-4
MILFSEFSTEALIDIERFQQQKVLDLRETLAGYVVLQIKMCRKVWHFISFLL